MVEIRELRSGEPDALIDLFETVLPGFVSSLTDHCDGPSTFLQDPSSFALGAYVDGMPVGLAWGIQMRAPDGRLTTYVHELDVRETWRRGGVATALIAKAQLLAREAGSTMFWLSTGGHNKVAQALYDSLGGDRKPLGDVSFWWNLE